VAGGVDVPAWNEGGKDAGRVGTVATAADMATATVSASLTRPYIFYSSV